MSGTMTSNVRVNSALAEVVACNVREGGACENVSEYARDLIGHDKESVEADRFERLKAELTLALAAPESAYEVTGAETIIARNTRGETRTARDR